MVRRISHRVKGGESGRTVVSVLRTASQVSHRAARGLVDAGVVTLDGQAVVDPAARVQEGARLEARFDPSRRYQPTTRRGGGGPGYRTVVEDRDLLVVEKASGVLTVPAGRSEGHSLVERLLAASSPAARRRGLWVVHRLDRYVSGLVVLARTQEALDHLRRQFARRTPLRLYLALCERAPPHREGRPVLKLEEDRRTRKMRPASAGRPAVLQYRVLERFRHASLVEVRLETGRRNQIRVQFAALGCPLVGDRSYGRPSPLIGRVGLHAARLEFVHPRTGATVRCSSPPPRDFRRALRALRAGARPSDEPQAVKTRRKST